MSLRLVLKQNSIKESKQINPRKTKQNNNFKKKEKRDSIQVNGVRFMEKTNRVRKTGKTEGMEVQGVL